MDLELCEQLLKIIDQPESIISVRTRGEFAVIPVLSQDADTVATEIKALFPDRIEGAGGGGGNANRGAPDPREFLAALTGGGGGRRGAGGGNSQLSEIKIAISVDKKTNSLLVMAPPQDIEWIKRIVQELDVAGGDVEEGVEVVSLSGTNLNVGMIDSALKSVLGSKARTNTNTNSSNTGSSSPAPQGGGMDADAMRRSAEQLQQLRERFGGGAGGAAPGGGQGFRNFGGGNNGFGGQGFRGFGGGGQQGGQRGGGGGQQGGRGGR